MDHVHCPDSPSKPPDSMREAITLTYVAALPLQVHRASFPVLPLKSGDAADYETREVSEVTARVRHPGKPSIPHSGTVSIVVVMLSFWSFFFFFLQFVSLSHTFLYLDRDSKSKTFKVWPT
ncbi:hypothetical protein LX32DRAFT_277399 [Colletotrichum zoysiae]|uniref:Uncharacterized protein n=1 Tax=Colletotrichum zoysiae TaxID=1216348 RepID=A0AAD9H4D3_9PEZI|nr:hypothetical protein LX32DRAFT_277399 [Colletotrichum zoysiae]